MALLDDDIFTSSQSVALRLH